MSYPRSELVGRGLLFTDPEFPPDLRALGGDLFIQQVAWVR
jgi:hypothetical protein